jgi:hypothetical protein
VQVKVPLTSPFDNGNLMNAFVSNYHHMEGDADVPFCTRVSFAPLHSI